jgi:hypothetical protein
VYYLFRGLRRGSDEPIIGRLSAPNEEAVHKVLEALGIVSEAVHREEDGGLFPPALQAELDEIGLRISFNQMPKLPEGHGVWILDPRRISGRVMQLAREVCGSAEDRQPALRRIDQLLEAHYGERRPASGTAVAGTGEGRFANADEVRAEIKRLQAAIKSLERELISLRSRPYADARPYGGKKTPRDRTQDDVLREIFEHNLKLMQLTRQYGITGLADQ